MKQRATILMTVLMLTACSSAFSGATPAGDGAPSAAAKRSALDGISVSGNKLVGGYGNTIHLHGINRSGTEYLAFKVGNFDGPNDAQSIAAMTTWNVNVVRIPLNEDCWLNVNGITNSTPAKTTSVRSSTTLSCSTNTACMPNFR